MLAESWRTCSGRDVRDEMSGTQAGNTTNLEDDQRPVRKVKSDKDAGREVKCMNARILFHLVGLCNKHPSARRSYFPGAPPSLGLSRLSSSFTARQMEQRISRICKFLLPTAVFLASLLLLGFTYHKYDFQKTWTSQELAAGAEPNLDLDLGHGPVSHPSTDPNDLSLRLHPEEHVHRKPRTVEIHWNVTKANRRPDGVAKDIYLINGQFPGPAIELRSGDELVVTVHNDLNNESTSIHWHGLGIANEMDGVVGVTQCSIAPGKEFQYRLSIRDDQSGSFWYHAHSDTQRADGLFGPLIVHRPANNGVSEGQHYGYDDDQVLMIGDWYHRDAVEVLETYTDWKNFKIEPAPDSLLLNGRGYFECSRATRARPVDCVNNAMPNLALPARTRLRVVNVGALTGFTLSMVGYTIKLVQVDGGHPVESVVAEKIGILYPGERMDLILERRTSEYQSGWITISLDRENMQFPNLALIDTQQFPVSPGLNFGQRLPSRQKVRSQEPWIDLSSVRGMIGTTGEIGPRPVDETILLYTTISYLTEYEYRPKGFVNHTSWTPSTTDMPLLAQERSEWPRDPAPMVHRVRQDSWVELVINNMDDKGHPFHLHGQDFYVLRSQKPSRIGAFEQYNPFDEADRSARAELNVQNPLMRDTVYVPSMGHVVLRFKASNPGIWLVHCHVLWHEAVGMNVALQVGPDADVSQRKAASRACGS